MTSLRLANNMAGKNKPNLYKGERCNCTGEDGRRKELYGTFQSAYDRANYIEGSRGEYLDVYPCPHGCGFHLTKKNAASGIDERREAVFQSNNIPLQSANGIWELVKSEDSDTNLNEYNPDEKIPMRRKNNRPVPIAKVKCKPTDCISGLTGTVMEIIHDVDTGKIFDINPQNVICASLIKHAMLDGILYQITIHADNAKSNRKDSYTILVKKDLLKNIRLAKGMKIKLDIMGKSLNNIAIWYCKTMEAASL